MILYVWIFDGNIYRKSAVIDNATSIIWIKRFNSAGQFELYLRATEALVDLFEADEIMITRENDDTAMIVEKVELTTDYENGDYLTITGRSAESIIGRRIIPRQTTYNGTTENVIRQMITENVVNPSDEWRKMDLVSLETAHGWTETIEKQATGTNLLQTISDICVAYNYGFSLSFNGSDFVFKLYKGVDRSFAQNTQSYVIFSPEFENLGNTAFSRDISTYYNSVYVGGEGEGIERVIVNADKEDKEGLLLREKWLDCRNVSSKIEGGTLPYIEYASMLITQGKEELGVSKQTTNFSGEILVSSTYKVGVDYNLGDTVQIVNAYGFSGTAVVTEISEVEDENGNTIYPTLSKWTLDLNS